jgi:hypothetical protein
MMAESPTEKPEAPVPAMQACEVCAAKVTELRRGRCWGCYTKWADNRPVGLGAACCMCNDRRREHLRQVELLGAWVPICHNCAARTTRLSPMPQSFEDIRERLDRERRARDRRHGKSDTRVFQRDRRGLERRHTGAANGNDMMLIDDEDILIIEAGELPSNEPGDETRIQPPPIPGTAR